MLNKVFDTFMFFKKKNFTVTNEYDMGDGLIVKEYTYNLSKYLTDVWPPNLSSSSGGFPIRSAVREEDGSDVTERVLRFSGPRKNYVNPVSAYRKRRRIRVSFLGWGGIRISVADVWEKYTGNVIVTDIFGVKKTVPV